MIEDINYAILENNGFTKEHLNYIKECSNQQEWENNELQKRWIIVIRDMSNIIYEWEKDHINFTTQ